MDSQPDTFRGSGFSMYNLQRLNKNVRIMTGILIKNNIEVMVLKTDFSIPNKPLFRIKYYRGTEHVLFCNNLIGKHIGLNDNRWNFKYKGKIYFVVFSCLFNLITNLQS